MIALSQECRRWCQAHSLQCHLSVDSRTLPSRHQRSKDVLYLDSTAGKTFKYSLHDFVSKNVAYFVWQKNDHSVWKIFIIYLNSVCIFFSLLNIFCILFFTCHFRQLLFFQHINANFLVVKFHLKLAICLFTLIFQSRHNA